MCLQVIVLVEHRACVPHHHLLLHPQTQCACRSLCLVEHRACVPHHHLLLHPQTKCACRSLCWSKNWRAFLTTTSFYTLKPNALAGHCVGRTPGVRPSPPPPFAPSNPMCLQVIVLVEERACVPHHHLLLHPQTKCACRSLCLIEHQACVPHHHLLLHPQHCGTLMCLQVVG